MSEALSIMNASLRLGSAMLSTGGEVNRVEDTITRFLTAYEFTDVEVFSTLTQINLTCISADNETLTQTRRVKEHGTDLEKLAQLNELSRQSCSNRPSPEYIMKRIAEIMKQEKNSLYEYLGSMVGASACTVFFGGDLVDGLVTAILALFITYLGRHDFYRSRNILLIDLLCSVATGLLANVLLRLGLGHHLDKILIGAIMLTIPGSSLTYSVRDMLEGDTVTGMTRFVEALLAALTIAGGFILSTILFDSFFMKL